MNLGGPCKRSVVLAALILASVTVQGEAFHPSSHKTSCGTNRKDTMCFSSKDDEQEDFEVQTWNPLRLAVLKLGLTEPAMTSPFNYGKKEGIFTCAYCGKELFDSNAKYDSGSGWPSFWRSIEDGAMNYKMEFDGRLECRCGRCTSHLGHVFLDGPKSGDVPNEILGNSPSSDPRGKLENGRLPRFCVNGASLRLNARQESSNN
jgi:peptide-methionine (R)-S-oxide reductase